MAADDVKATSERSAVKGWLDYLLGRNALIGVAALMLLILSGYATWKGMYDFILGVQATTGGAQTLGGPAGLEVQTEYLIIFLVVALTLLMWLALRETFGARRTFGARMITLPLYLFLAIWSIGFGYGFWWSLIAGPEATKAGLSGQAEDVRDAAVIVKARLEAVRARLDSVVAHSERQMSREASAGGSCGIASGAGQGPLFRAREGVRDSVAGLQSDITQNWLSAVDMSLKELNEQLANAGTAVSGETLAERQQKFERAAANIRGKAGEISARSNSLGAAYASQMRGLADEVAIAPREDGFSCYDPTLASLLREAAKEAERELDVSLRPAAFSEGAAGVANAVLGLWTNIGDYAAALPSYIVGGETPAATEGQGVTGRDLIALLAALGVDLGLFALTALNPPPARLPISVEAEVKRAVSVTMNRTGKDLTWIKKHLFAHGDRVYFAIPNYYSCLNEASIAKAEDDELIRWGEVSEKERAEQGWQEVVRGKLRDEIDGDELDRGQALNLLAGVLAASRLIRLLKERELEKARADEERRSQSIMPRFDENEKATYETIRNHGVLSKARHALKDAGWSRNARKDAEIYILLDSKHEGLSAFLRTLNEAGNA